MQSASERTERFHPYSNPLYPTLSWNTKFKVPLTSESSKRRYYDHRVTTLGIPYGSMITHQKCRTTNPNAIFRSQPDLSSNLTLDLTTRSNPAVKQIDTRWEHGNPAQSGYVTPATHNTMRLIPSTPNQIQVRDPSTPRGPGQID